MAFSSFVAMFLGPFYHLLPGFRKKERKKTDGQNYRFFFVIILK
jgi:hypothetical protein